MGRFEVIVLIVSVLRTFLALGVGLVAGGIVGAYAMTVVYGQRQSAIEPAKITCPACPVCPSPSPCPVAAADPDVDTSAGPDTPPATAAPEPLDLPPEGLLPGLPSSALKLASSGFAREIAACLDQAKTEGATGSLLLDLTVTSTGGIGHIREAALVRADPTAAALHPCLVEAARRVHFEWAAGDGESRLRYPVPLTAPSP